MWWRSTKSCADRTNAPASAGAPVAPRLGPAPQRPWRRIRLCSSRALAVRPSACQPGEDDDRHDPATSSSRARRSRSSADLAVPAQVEDLGARFDRHELAPGQLVGAGCEATPRRSSSAATTNPVGLVAKPQRGGPCLGDRTSARRADGHRFPVMVIPIVTEQPLALEPTTRDDFLGSQAAPRPTPVSRVTAAGSRA